MRRGFTLLEVLVGLALMALIVGVIQGVYTGVSRSGQRARSDTEAAHAGALLLHRLADELNGAFPASLSVRSASESFSELSFEMPGGAAPQTAAEDAAPRGNVSLTYAVERGEEDVNALTRSESQTGTATPSAEPIRLLLGLTRFRVLSSGDGKSWSESTAGGGEADGPKLLSVEVGWREGRGDNARERVLRTLIPLYRAIG